MFQIETFNAVKRVEHLLLLAFQISRPTIHEDLVTRLPFEALLIKLGQFIGILMIRCVLFESVSRLATI